MYIDKRRYGVVVTFFCVSALAAPSSQTKVYRTDYTYSKHTNAFYKLHTESRSTKEAREKCDAEGAQLMVPLPQDIRQLHAMFKRFPDLGEYVLVESDRQSHDPAGSSDEVPMVPSNYIPKKTVGSCYKVPKIVYSWNEANAECKAEGAHLVVLNSEAEHEVVKTIMETAVPVRGSKTTYFFFAGIRANHPTDGTPRVFKTITNQTLEEAGYFQWSDNEPNNYQDSEYCGSLFKNDGKYNDLNCSHKYAFICEKEAQIL
ncbi:hemolymph lipopolysaccharide-binding protein isoform X3 [Cydia strobilella]|uniref:hemolymph lipopolysaccharide-binding protein isoform X3 n=1 Tax=Cydia strobilella TaxID=1100964 RepID=UPI003007A3F0